MTVPEDDLGSALLAPARRAYARRLQQCGATARGVFWRDEAWQARRYDILATLFRPVHRSGGISIADLGCGYGAFFDYLAPRPVMAESRYVGYDMTEEMIGACQARISDPRASFVVAPQVAAAADYVFASGTFNLKMNAEDAPWQGYVMRAIAEAWDQTRVGFAFNMLDVSYDPRAHQEGLFYADATTFEAFCRRLAPHVTLRRDPPLPDWTIFMWR
jgi:SAM-dependent methyltransferase